MEPSAAETEGLLDHGSHDQQRVQYNDPRLAWRRRCSRLDLTWRRLQPSLICTMYALVLAGLAASVRLFPSAVRGSISFKAALAPATVGMLVITPRALSLQGPARVHGLVYRIAFLFAFVLGGLRLDGDITWDPYAVGAPVYCLLLGSALVLCALRSEAGAAMLFHGTTVLLICWQLHVHGSLEGASILAASYWAIVLGIVGGLLLVVLIVAVIGLIMLPCNRRTSDAGGVALLLLGLALGSLIALALAFSCCVLLMKLHKPSSVSSSVIVWPAFIALCLLAVLLVIVALALPWLQSLPLQRQFSAQRHAPPTCHMCRAVVQDVCVLQESQVAADRVCVACQDQRANTVLVPCGHGGMCQDCVNTMLASHAPLTGDIESGRATQEDGEDGANIVEGVTSSGRVMRFRDMGTEWFRRVASNM